MHPIEIPAENWQHGDDVLAQSVAGNLSWQQDESGTVYDQKGIVIGPDLRSLGAAMRELGWFAPREALATGVIWSDLPQDADDAADAVRRHLPLG